MAPTPCRHPWMWSVPTIVILFTFLWYKRKRGSSQSDPGGTARKIRKASSCVNEKQKALPAKVDGKIASDLPVDRRALNGEAQVPPEKLAEEFCINERTVEVIEVPVEESEAPTIKLIKENWVHKRPDEGLQESVQKNEASSNLTEKSFDSECSDFRLKAVEDNCVVKRAVEVFEDPEDRSESSSVKCEDRRTVELTTALADCEVPAVNCIEEVECDLSFLEDKRSASEDICREIVSGPLFAENGLDLDDEKEGDLSVKHLGDAVSEFASSTPERVGRFKEPQSTEAEIEPRVSLTNGEYSLPDLENNVEGRDQELEAEEDVPQVSDGSEIREVAERSESSECKNVGGDSCEVTEVGRDSETCVVARNSEASESRGAEKDSGYLESNENNSSGVSDVSSLSPSDSETASETCVEATKCCSTDASAASLPATPELQATSTVAAEEMQRPAQEEGAAAAAVAASDGDALAGKLAALELGKGRDSANHSPAEVMLASPSVSSYSDEGSSDSGKGCSDVATPPSRTPASGSSVSGDAPLPSVYEFVLPQHLVGRLIGRHGVFVHQIKAKTNASILIKRHPETPKLKICAVEGTQMDIEGALEMIRKKFPLKMYPNVTLEQVCFVPTVPMYPLMPECLQLPLVEGVSNDVILSSLVSPGHFFLQQPTHPTFPSLNRLNNCMNTCYREPNVPLLPMPIEPGVICAAPAMGGWYRAQVVSVDAENETYEVKFVDYGGYLTLEHSELRQIRTDFMMLPFQASECFLANVQPAGGEEALWTPEAIAVMEELTHGQVLQAQVCDYSENIPNVLLYAVHCNQTVLVNHELVVRGLAEWQRVVEPEVVEASC